MNLENIGFYTLSDERAKNVSWDSDLQRCELILTDRCNFKCSYCRGIKKEFQGDLSLEQAKEIVDIWAQGSLHNIRFSGGEPTLWKDIFELVDYTKKKGVKRIAISTNGSAPLKVYEKLSYLGVNDFSISLDACCASTADSMSGVVSHFDHISNVIKQLSQLTYVTAGVVLDDRNENELLKILDYATELGVGDIRIIPSAQSNKFLSISYKTNMPILNYRLANLKKGRHLRGIQDSDCNKCHLVKDDMAVLHGNHFPCVIYMREQGKAIGSMYGKSIEDIRIERKRWFDSIDTQKDAICKKNCLDVCIDHNNKVDEYRRIYG
jgi:sulfatase maturation enzyme AslB (radical SAM superfamily)